MNVDQLSKSSDISLKFVCWLFYREYSAVKSEVDLLKNEQESLRTQRDVSQV